MLAELRQIRVALERKHTRRSAPSHQDDAAIVAAIVAAFAGRVFSAEELRPALGGLTTREIGTRLRGLAGRTIDGYAVRRVVRHGGGVVWEVQVQVNVDRHTPSGECGDEGA